MCSFLYTSVIYMFFYIHSENMNTPSHLKVKPAAALTPSPCPIPTFRSRQNQNQKCETRPNRSLCVGHSCADLSGGRAGSEQEEEEGLVWVGGVNSEWPGALSMTSGITVISVD